MTAAAPEGRPRADRRWIPLVVVIAVIGVVVGGAQAAALVGRATPGTVAVGDVRVTPAEGWEVASSSATPPTVELHRGPVVLAIVGGPPEPAGPLALATRYVDERLRSRYVRLVTGTAAPTLIAGGVPAVRFGYVGVAADGTVIEGVVVAASDTRAAVVFDAAAPHGALASVAEDVRSMIDGAVVL